jgi:polyisoprenoid-binding protein YceI
MHVDFRPPASSFDQWRALSHSSTLRARGSASQENQMKAFALLLALLGSSAAAIAAPVHYTLDPPHTQVLFSWDHLGYSHPTGEFDHVDGELVYDAANPAASSLHVSIPVATLHTHVPALDRQLLGPMYLNAEKYPLITFVSSKVKVEGKKRFKVEGQLTLHGVTRPVTLDVTLNKAGKYPMIEAPALGFGASTTFSRSAFGVGYGVPMVGDTLRVTISTEAIESHAYQTKVLPMEKAGK